LTTISNDTTRLIVTSDGNVGIGTTNPGSLLDVTNVVNTAYDASNTLVSGQTMRVANTSTTSGVSANLLFIATGAGGGNGLGSISGVNTGTGSLALTFATRNNSGSVTERMRITSGGNVGIGTTAPNSASVDRALTISGTSNSILEINYGATRGAYLFSNSINTVLSSVQATPLLFNTSDTERMRITSGGNVLIGGTVAQNNASNRGNLTINGTTSILNLSISDTNAGYLFHGGTDLLLVNAKNGASLFYTNDTERMRITSGGNVGIGTTAPSALLHVLGTGPVPLIFASTSTTSFYTTYRYNTSTDVGYIGNGSGVAGGGAATDFGFQALGNMLFAAGGGTERMRITSGGSVLVGQTSLTSAEKVGISFDRTSQQGLIIKNTSSTSPSSATYIDFYYASTQTGSVASTGTTTSYNTTSDYRLKQDLKPINGLELVSKIKVYDYEWKLDKTRMDGVLAHELAEVLPYAVTGVKDGEQMQGVDYSKIVPVMVQAIKELKAELDILKNK
jgi:hypothetical protein